MAIVPAAPYKPCSGFHCPSVRCQLTLLHFSRALPKSLIFRQGVASGLTLERSPTRRIFGDFGLERSCSRATPCLLPGEGAQAASRISSRSADCAAAGDVELQAPSRLAEDTQHDHTSAITALIEDTLSAKSK
ncbi:hypothetical protein PsYK624_014580 [Phanerochaete sordida]|uniref:Uncharacterized protein n=1 Tax=Phanerochaete sordida TaxID=48140 RepID=A0A9P3FZX3_9APHY|nr:hypothetical protein PsYK624_014580 [Phanerochaete sordida]